MSVIGFKKSAVLLFAFAIWFLITSLYAFEVKTPGSSFFKTKLTRVSSVIDLDFSNSVTKLDFLLEWSDKVEPVLINTVAYEIESKYEGKTLAPISTKGKSFAPVEGAKSLPFVINIPYLKRAKAETFSIQGKIQAIIPVGFEQIEFGSLSKLFAEGVKDQPGVNKKGSSSSLKKATTGTTKISFGIQTEIGAQGPEFDTSQNWAVLNQLKLVNKKNLKEVSKSFSEAKKSFVDKMGGKKMNSKEKTHADRVVEKQDFTTSRDR
jgi:flagellar hook-associated protein FlgK